MSVEAEHKESRISRFLARRWAVPLVIAGAVTIVTLACLAPELFARWQLPGERDAIRARGEPATLAELAPTMPPDNENAAVLLVKAFQLIRAARAAEVDGWRDFLRKDGEDSLAHRDDVAAAVKLHAKAMALARKALARPKCVFDIDYSRGFASFDYLGEVEHLCSLLRAEATLLALDGRCDRAASNICLIFAITEVLGLIPVDVCLMIGSSIMENSIITLARIENQHGFTDKERRMLITRLASLDWRRSAEQSIVTTRVMWVDGFDASFAHAKKLFPGRLSLRARFFSFGFPSRRAKLRIMRIMTKAVEASRLPPWRALPAVKYQINLAWQQMPGWDAVGVVDVSMTETLMLGRAVAVRDTAILGLSYELFRSAKGRYPAKLSELVPEFLKEVPPDPFTGKPFRYELRDNGCAFIVYSVGDNLRNDGGVGKPGGKDDIAYRGSAAMKQPAPPADESRGE